MQHRIELPAYFVKILRYMSAQPAKTPQPHEDSFHARGVEMKCRHVSKGK